MTIERMEEPTGVIERLEAPSIYVLCGSEFYCCGNDDILCGKGVSVYQAEKPSGIVTKESAPS